MCLLVYMVKFQFPNCFSFSPRMLGGYYHRMRSKTNNGENHLAGNAKTLGSLVAQSSGDVYEFHPAWIGQMNHYKLVGVYDKKIQKLANSRTVQVVSSCLALALSEYEVSRTRAHALTRLNSSSALMKRGQVDDSLLQPVFESEDGDSESAPSTASSLSLTRLRFTVTSIFAMREAARFKLCYFGSYLSRSILVFSGLPVVGEGLDGCSRESLDFLVAYNPDSALLLDTSALFDALLRGQWIRRPMSEVMVSVLAAGTIPDKALSSAIPSLLLSEEKVVIDALSIAPESRGKIFKRLLPQNFGPSHLPEARSFAAKEIPQIALQLNAITALLYMVREFENLIPYQVLFSYTDSDNLCFPPS